MDELRLLRELRADLPAPREHRRQAARAALLARAEHSAPRRTPWAPRFAGRRLVIIAAAATFAALLVAVPTLILGGGGAVPPALAQVMSRAANVAAVQVPQARPGPGQYLYTRSREAYLTSVGYNPKCATHPCDREHLWEATRNWSILVPSLRQTWIAANGTGRARVVAGKPRFLTAAQRRAWKAAGSPELSSGGVEDFALSGLPFLDTSGLPTDPKALRSLIEARKAPQFTDPPGEAETFTLIGDLLRVGYLPPEFRAALFLVIAELPEIELLGQVSDPIGRPGTAVAYTKGRIRHELIFDPKTSALLAERDVAAFPVAELQVPAGTETGSTTYLESRVVDSLGAGAPPGAGKIHPSVACYEQPSVHGNAAILHSADPIATCAKLWHEGSIGSVLRRRESEGKIPKRPGRYSPHLVACATEVPGVTYVFPGSAAVCGRLGL